MPQLLQGQICKNVPASNDADRFPTTFLKVLLKILSCSSL